MISRKELTEIARARLKDSETLFQSNRYDGSIYLCGYALEIGLKVKICGTLNWDGFPDTNSEFNKYQSFRTHDLDTLLALSGVEKEVKVDHLANWSAVAEWDPNVRYKPIGNAKREDAELMIESAKILLRILI